MKKITSLLSLLIWLNSMNAQNTGMFEGNEDVGNPLKKGSATYNTQTQEYTMSCAGKNMWANDDQFRFLWKKIKGDFMISATVRFIGKGTDLHRKIGVIARNELTANSPYADACVHGDGLTSLQSRHADTAQTVQIVMASNRAVNIELQRIGNTFTFSAATPGENYKTASKELLLNEEVYAGLFICSHNENVVEQAVFSNVRIIIPPAKDYRPYRDYIGSYLELMDVQTGLRKIIYSETGSIQCPNWTKDGKSLIFNSSGGLLYNYNFASGSVSKINSGTAINNNNDHVLSPDGKMIAISNYVGEKRTSTIFTLPLTGSDYLTKFTSQNSALFLSHLSTPNSNKLLFTV